MSHLFNEEYDCADRADKADGKFVRINNKWLIDTSMAAGTHIFGHGAITPAIKKALNKGTLYMVPNKIADDCADLLHTITKFEHFVFCSTGSEATLRCIRIARAYTGRNKIALFEGCWHGTHDWNLALYSEGIPQAVKDLVLVLPFTEKAFERIAQNDIAMVMVEPVQSSLPINRKEFLNKLRKVCTDTLTVLCFDEIISGFRMAPGGAAQYFNIKPDIVAYGKIVGGGFPIGVVGGDGVMEVIKKGPRGVRMGGTFSANPVTMTACKKVLEMLIKHDIYKPLHNLMANLSKIQSNILQIMILGGMARVLFTNKTIETIKERDENEMSYENQKLIKLKLQEKGIHLGKNNVIALSTRHSNEDIKIIAKCIENIQL